MTDTTIERIDADTGATANSPGGESVGEDSKAPVKNSTMDVANPVKESTMPAAASPDDNLVKSLRKMKILVALFGAAALALLIATIVLAVDKGKDNDAVSAAAEDSSKPDPGENPCAGKRPQLDNVNCVDADLEEIFTTGEQSGANVTQGYNGQRNTTAVPITKPYREVGLCPVNVHWHIGAEHYSLGEFDETGDGPIDFHEGRQGFQCKYYDENDPKFTTPFEWEHCIGMTIGQTYEVHWPHSKAGRCNTQWQYQTPFYDGVFCGDIDLNNTAQEIGVQSQTFTVINDEEYFYPDLFSGMIVNEAEGRGVDLAIYTGSTTGTQRDNNVCSPFSPITWQVDRKCHLISASSFDKMCGQMKEQADNLGDDLYAHGARELVADVHAANNHQTRRERGLLRAVKA